MEFVMNELGVLGDHFGLVIIGCAELAIAAVYAGILLSRRTKNIRTKLALRDVEQKFLDEFSGKTDECCIVMENQNRLPLYAAGNLEGLMGVTLDEIRRDILSMGRKWISWRRPQEAPVWPYGCGSDIWFKKNKFRKKVVYYLTNARLYGRQIERQERKR